MPGSWIRVPVRRRAAQVRLFCFPHAGAGGSVYWPWSKDLPDWIEVCAVELPGRETRLKEQPFTRMSDLLDALIPAIEDAFDRPFAFFGHSMGSALAHEAAVRLEQSGGPAPAHLFVSGRRSPTLAESEPPLHPLPDDEFLAEIMNRYGGIPEELLEHPDVISLLLPSIRADITVLETSAKSAGLDGAQAARLSCPITAFGGIDDPRATRAKLDAWAELTSGAFRLRMFAGGHFYLTSQRGPLLRELEAAMIALRTTA